MAPPLVRHIEGEIMGGVCVMEHRKKKIEVENLDPSWSVRYDNMEGGLLIGWFAPKKVEAKSGTLEFIPRSSPHSKTSEVNATWSSLSSTVKSTFR